MAALRIGVVGDYTPEFHSHPQTNHAIRRAAQSLGESVEISWVRTDTVPTEDPGSALSAYDALWAAPGSPYRSFAGALAGIGFARQRMWPFVGT